MPIVTPMTKEELEKLLSTRNSAAIPLTPEEKIDRIFLSLRGKGKRIDNFHFNLVENGTKTVLFDGNKVKCGEFPKDRRGIIEARVTARKLFTSEKRPEKKNGGFKFDCLLIDEFGGLKEEKDV